MNRATTFVTGALSGLAAVAGWRYYRSRRATQVTYESRRLLDGIEIREYPTVVVAETTADSVSEARSRIRSYLSGANTAETAIQDTTPIRTHSEPIALSTPTGSQSTDRVRVSVYLSPSYTPQTAPEPTDRSVLLTVETPRTVAVRAVPRYPRVDRFERAETQLHTAIVDNELVAVGDPFVFRYDNSFCGSLTRRAEVAVEIQ